MKKKKYNSGATHIEEQPLKQYHSDKGTTDQQDSPTHGTTQQEETDLSPGRDAGLWTDLQKAKKKMHNGQ